MSFIKKYIRDLIYIALFAIIIMQTCGKFTPKNSTVIRDSVITYVIHDTTIREKPVVTNTTVPTQQTIIERYYYDTTAKDLKEKYIELAKKFETSRMFSQTIPIDTLGAIHIKDTVAQNDIKGRSVVYHIKERKVFVKETTIEHLPPKRQLYLGGELGVNSIGVNSGHIGVMYKDRRDNAYKISGGIHFNMQPQVTFGYYKPIKFNK